MPFFFFFVNESNLYYFRKLTFRGQIQYEDSFYIFKNQKGALFLFNKILDVSIKKLTRETTSQHFLDLERLSKGRTVKIF